MSKENFFDIISDNQYKLISTKEVSDGELPVYKYSIYLKDSVAGNIIIRTGIDKNTKYIGNICWEIKENMEAERIILDVLKLLLDFFDANKMEVLYLAVSFNDTFKNSQALKLGFAFIETLQEKMKRIPFKKDKPQLINLYRKEIIFI